MPTYSSDLKFASRVGVAVLGAFSTIALAGVLLISNTGAAMADDKAPAPVQSTDDIQPLTAPDRPHVSFVEPDSRKISFGLRAGVYLPTNTSARNRFGDDWLSYGFFMTRLGETYDKGRVTPDIRFISRAQNSDSVFIMPIGLEYRKSFDHDGGHENTVRPYFGYSADAVFSWVQIPEQNISNHETTTVGASAFVGFKVKRTYIEARYQETGKANGYDLSGLEVTAGVAF
jgi:hypothetical protein